MQARMTQAGRDKLLVVLCQGRCTRMQVTAAGSTTVPARKRPTCTSAARTPGLSASRYLNWILVIGPMGAHSLLLGQESACCISDQAFCHQCLTYWGSPVSLLLGTPRRRQLGPTRPAQQASSAAPGRARSGRAAARQPCAMPGSPALWSQPEPLQSIHIASPLGWPQDVVLPPQGLGYFDAGD